MQDLALIIVIISLIGIIYFWKKDKKKRNLSVLVALLAFIVFGVSEDESEDTEENAFTEEQATDDEAEEIDYEIVEEEYTELGGFNRLELRVTTSDQPEKNQIEELLNELEMEVENEYEDHDLDEDQLYIFLYENELITDGMYSLGRLVRTEAETEIDARQKDWEKQPSEYEYELYVKFMDKAMELEEEALEEDSDSFVEDDDIIAAVAIDENTDEETVSESVQKVSEFMMMNVE